MLLGRRSAAVEHAAPTVTLHRQHHEPQAEARPRRVRAGHHGGAGTRTRLSGPPRAEQWARGDALWRRPALTSTTPRPHVRVSETASSPLQGTANVKALVSDLKGGSAAALQTAHVSVRLFQSPRIVLFTRTNEPFEAVADVERCIRDFARIMPARSRAQWRIVIDMRLGPTRVHPALDPAFARLRKETQVGFTRVAVIVETPLGRVRAERLASTSDVPHCVVHTLEDAVEFLNQ
jgi:hypothetical protein